MPKPAGSAVDARGAVGGRQHEGRSFSPRRPPRSCWRLPRAQVRAPTDSPSETQIAVGPSAWPSGTTGQYGLHIDPSLAGTPASVDRRLSRWSRTPTVNWPRWMSPTWPIRTTALPLLDRPDRGRQLAPACHRPPEAMPIRATSTRPGADDAFSASLLAGRRHLRHEPDEHQRLHGRRLDLLRRTDRLHPHHRQRRPRLDRRPRPQGPRPPADPVPLLAAGAGPAGAATGVADVPRQPAQTGTDRSGVARATSRRRRLGLVRRPPMAIDTGSKPKAGPRPVRAPRGRTSAVKAGPRKPPFGCS